jgi:hypothetical protein
MLLRQTEEPARLLQHVAEGVEPAGAGDEVEEIAMLPRGEINPAPASALAAVRPGEPHHQAAARGVVDVADAPCVPFAATIREVFATHRLARQSLTRQVSERICRDFNRQTQVWARNGLPAVDCFPRVRHAAHAQGFVTPLALRKWRGAIP